MSNSPQTAAVILARMDSSRLPGKALLHLAGVPIIEHVIRRLHRCAGLDAMVLATTSRDVDRPLAEHAAQCGLPVYLAPEDEINNVARRFVNAAKSVGADYALRINGDSPFPHPWLIQQGIEELHGAPDLVTNLLVRTYPYGVSVEWVKVATLEKALPGLGAAESEHVTACFYRSPERFRIHTVPDCPWPSCRLRMTVDEPGDLETLEHLITRLPQPAWEADLKSILEAAREIEGEGPAAGS